MGWAVILLPDEAGEAAAKRVWRAVYLSGFCSMLFEGDNRPHVSLTVLDTQDGTLEEAARRFAVQTSPATVTFAGIGAFGEDVVYLSPEPTAALRELNRKLTAELGPLAALADPRYLPGTWQPHMTAAFKIPEGEFKRAMKAVKMSFRPFQATFDTVAVVKFNPVKIVGMYKLGENPPEEKAETASTT
jgi:2'-5' RNA ligase